LITCVTARNRGVRDSFEIFEAREAITGSNNEIYREQWDSHCIFNRYYTTGERNQDRRGGYQIVSADVFKLFSKVPKKEAIQEL
jgi:hypothetical protein